MPLHRAARSRLQRLHRHLGLVPPASTSWGACTHAAAAPEPDDPRGCRPELPLLSWDTILRHSMPQDAWVVIYGTVYDITEFIADDGVVSGHPGGQAIPLEYAGKDATAFWEDMHGHLAAEIMEDIASGEGTNTGLELMPTVVGRADGAPPAAARGPGFPSTNWAGNVIWRGERRCHSFSFAAVQTCWLRVLSLPFVH